MLLRVRNGNHLRRLFPIGCHDGFEQILRGGRRVGNRVGSGKNRFADGFVRLAAGGDQGHLPELLPDFAHNLRRSVAAGNVQNRRAAL